MLKGRCTLNLIFFRAWNWDDSLNVQQDLPVIVVRFRQDYVQGRLGRHLALRPLPVEERLIVLAAWGSKDGDGASG